MNKTFAIRALMLAATALVTLLAAFAVNATGRLDAETTAASATGPVTLSGHVLEALSNATSIDSPKSASDVPISLTVVLKRSDEASFQAYLADVYNEGSPNFRKFLSTREIADRFGPSEQDFARVKTFFEANGLALVEGSVNRMTMLVNGSRSSAEQALSVQIKQYRLGGREFYANVGEPSVTPSIAAHVEAIAGLSNLDIAQPNHKLLLFVCKLAFSTTIGGLSSLLVPGGQFFGTGLEIAALGGWLVCIAGGTGELIGVLFRHGNPQSTVLMNPLSIVLGSAGSVGGEAMSQPRMKSAPPSQLPATGLLIRHELFKKLRR